MCVCVSVEEKGKEEVKEADALVEGCSTHTDTDTDTQL